MLEAFSMVYKSYQAFIRFLLPKKDKTVFKTTSIQSRDIKLNGF